MYKELAPLTHKPVVLFKNLGLDMMRVCVLLQVNNRMIIELGFSPWCIARRFKTRQEDHCEFSIKKFVG